MSTVSHNVTSLNTKFEPSMDSNKQQSSSTMVNAKGRYRGEMVTVHNAAYSVFDAMEELTSLGSEKAEKDLTKRAIKDRFSRSTQANQQLSEYLRKVPDLEKKQTLKELTSKISDGNIATIEQLQTYLDGFSSEKSHQYLALKVLKESLESSVNNMPLLEFIDHAVQNMEQHTDYWSRIDTEIRVSRFADDFSREQAFSSLHQLRGFYRDSVHSYQGLSAAYHDVVERFGSQQVSTAVEFMLQAMSADLSVQGCTIDSVKLQLLMSDMHKLKTLNTLQDQVNQVCLMLQSQRLSYGQSRG